MADRNTITSASNDKHFSQNDQRLFYINNDEKGEDRSQAQYIREVLDSKNAIIENAFYQPNGKLVLLIKRVGICAECEEHCKFGTYLCKDCKRDQLRARSD